VRRRSIRWSHNSVVIQQHLSSPTLFFITLEASPKPGHLEYGHIDGAFVSCWVNEPTRDLAEGATRAEIESAGWDVVELDECRRVIRDEYLENPDALEHFDQASIDGLVLTFHTWPIGADED